MKSVPVSPRRIFGVDFSAAGDAGDHIWVCRAHPGSEGVRVESVEPLSSLPGGAVPREEAFRALVQKIIESPRSAWGLGFSFALPLPVIAALAPAVKDHGGQIEIITSFGDPESMRARCMEATPGEERRRTTDSEASMPFSPYDPSVYRQTFYGISEVLRPLRARPEVAILPFDRLPDASVGGGDRLPFNRRAQGTAPHIYVMEVRPAAVLARLEHSTSDYKGQETEQREGRRAIVARLTDDGVVRPMARSMRERIVADTAGDAVDALLAAVGAWRGIRDNDHAALAADPSYGVEGFVYT
jgi:hypothetical protein